MSRIEKVRVEFTNVGRGKRSWVAEIPATYAAIEREVRKHGGLASSGVDVDFDDPDLTRGSIFVGGFRKVGEFAIREAAPAEGGRDG